jgi:D-xylose transport system permease protein
VATEPAPAPSDQSIQNTLSDQELLTAAPEVLANSLSEYLRAWGQRIRNGESGAMPVILGLILIIIFFEAENSAFLHAGDIVNMLVESTIYVMLGAAEIFILLLSEIDLSLGFGAGVGAMVIAELIAPPVDFPWWLAIVGGMVFVGGLGAIQGSLVSRIGLPSFVVTLGGQLAFQGLLLVLANADSTAVGGTVQIDPSSPVYKLVNSTMSAGLSWGVMIAAVALFAAASLWKSRTRRSRGLTTPPLGVTAITILGAIVGGVALELICDANTPQGMPWVFPFVLAVLVFYSWLLGRTRIGRYIYAVGASPEAARRAGINVKWVITFAFIMAGVTACLAGVIYESSSGSMSIDINGGQLVLFAVATAVIGGTSLFGGRGKIFNALLGGIVIAVVYNGLSIMGAGDAAEDIAVAVVLILAVTLDALVRRRSTTR